MKITRLTTFLVPPRWLFVRVDTEENLGQRYHVRVARRLVILLVPAEREIVAALRKDPGGNASSYPAARVAPAGSVRWFFDRGAVG